MPVGCFKPNVCRFLNKRSVLVEDLDTRLFRCRLFVDNKQAALHIDCEGVGTSNWPGPEPLVPPMILMNFPSLEFHDPGVASLPVRNEEIAILGNSHVTGTVECVLRRVIAFDALLANRQDLLSVDGEFENHVVFPVRNPEETFPVKIDTVRFFEQTAPPGFLELPPLG